ncbi:hypothetical protein MAPG_04499 [Magnaporthiopsis poae ATCC 64411]|uniref:Uncharacterized protein n=1 Tax=Magnaporthiopsis poae (strain ATCC 64411 / 73-15) TaxID=644358 RepID=A0A0C4DWW5_MAGP6|nr:hypothetical protein MAPG_04499 [Magnaporthiopsis poae ATCC 64411]
MAMVPEGRPFWGTITQWQLPQDEWSLSTGFAVCEPGSRHQYDSGQHVCVGGQGARLVKGHG